MKIKVVGVGTRRSGKSQKTGKAYDGTTIYGLTTDKEVQGNRTEEIYLNHLSGLTIPDFKVGDVIDVGYTKNGFIESVSVVKSAQ